LSYDSKKKYQKTNYEPPDKFQPEAQVKLQPCKERATEHQSQPKSSPEVHHHRDFPDFLDGPDHPEPSIT
jgi:hypothetical protein